MSERQRSVLTAGLVFPASWGDRAFLILGILRTLKKLCLRSSLIITPRFVMLVLDVNEMVIIIQITKHGLA